MSLENGLFIYACMGIPSDEFCVILTCIHPTSGRNPTKFKSNKDGFFIVKHLSAMALVKLGYHWMHINANIWNP